MDRRLWAAFAAVVLAFSVAGVVAAKDGALASLETPIPPDADPGTKIDVAWRAGMPDAGTDWPFSGSPVFIRLVPATGGRSTEAMGRERPPGSGHYEATIAIPSGGVGRVEIGLFGESCVNGTCTRSDLLFELPEEQHVPQAAAAPAVAPVTTAAAAASGRALTTDTTTNATPAVSSANLPIAVTIIGAGVFLLVAAIGLNRRTRTSAETAGG